jgi:hypothetical protein
MIVRGILLLATACVVGVSVPSSAQEKHEYDNLVQEGRVQLQAGNAAVALASAEGAIKLNSERWEAYALAGGALMSLKRYEDAVDKFSDATGRAPEAKQQALRELRRQCLLAESTPALATKEARPPTTQAEIVLWKSIENSKNVQEFELYLKSYPQGAFAALARRHIAEGEAEKERQVKLYGSLPNSVWVGEALAKTKKASDNFTIVLVFLDSGAIVWHGFVDNKSDRPQLEQIRSDMGTLSKEAFLRAHLPQLRNGGEFSLQGETMLKVKFSSKGNVHCQIGLDANLKQDTISGAMVWVGDSTAEARTCEKWPQYDSQLQRMFLQ